MAAGTAWYFRPNPPPPAEFRFKWPYPGIAYKHLKRKDPPQQIYVARIDLTNPRIRIRVAPAGPDPDGPGPWQTTLMTPSAIAAREHLVLAVNGDFFQAKDTRDMEGFRSGFTTGKWALARGPAVTDGKEWAKPKAPRAALLIDGQGRASIRYVQTVPPGTRQAVGGSCLILRNGGIPPQNGNDDLVHPRTIAGLASGGKTLVLAVVDGRRPGHATGMTLAQAGFLMHQLGCSDALNLDGGGSSQMVFRDPRTHAMRVVNWPSDDRERAVSNVLGISMEG